MVMKYAKAREADVLLAKRIWRQNDLNEENKCSFNNLKPLNQSTDGIC